MKISLSVWSLLSGTFLHQNALVRAAFSPTPLHHDPPFHSVQNRYGYQNDIPATLLTGKSSRKIPSTSSSTALKVQSSRIATSRSGTARAANKTLATKKAAKIAAAAAITVSAPVLSLPKVKYLLLANLLPPCLGYVKYEYGVSYAYGFATASTAYMLFQFLQSVTASGAGGLLGSPFTTLTSLATLHVGAILFYGIRLNLFLWYREQFIPRFRKFKDKIENRQLEKEGGGNKVLSRTPFILSCGFLYGGLGAPAFIVSKLVNMSLSMGTEASAPSFCPIAIQLYRILVGLTWTGFGIAALGDLTKTAVKTRKGADHLVTGGIFGLLRHPNYTGEMLGWSSSLAASFISIFAFGMVKSLKVWKELLPSLFLGGLGAFGIMFVLLAATRNLEDRQKEKYGENQEYQEWMESTWGGFALPEKDKKL